MTEIILVALRRAETAAGLLAAAAAAAASIPAARIEALAVRMPAAAMILPTEEVLGDEQRRRWEESEAARVAAIEAVYRGWRAGAGAGAESERCRCDWIDVEGMPEQEVAARGQRADLVVIDRPATSGREADRETVHAALFESHRPVLIVPSAAASMPGRRIAVAWRDDGRAIKAVIPALRYFGQAAEIAVLVGYRRGAIPTEMPPALAEHGVRATLYPLPIGKEPFGAQLLAKAAELGADLLVAGAYMHSPLREMLLGGVTRHLLAHAEIPLLMRH